MAHRRREHDYDFNVPWQLIDGDMAHAPQDGVDSEQHKNRRNQGIQKRSIRHYRHATGKWGAALESFKPIWVCMPLVSTSMHMLMEFLVRDSNIDRWSWTDPCLALSILGALAVTPRIRPLRVRNRAIYALLRAHARPLDHLPARCRASRALGPG